MYHDYEEYYDESESYNPIKALKEELINHPDKRSLHYLGNHPELGYVYSLEDLTLMATAKEWNQAAKELGITDLTSAESVA